MAALHTIANPMLATPRQLSLVSSQCHKSTNKRYGQVTLGPVEFVSKVFLRSLDSMNKMRPFIKKNLDSLAFTA